MHSRINRIGIVALAFIAASLYRKSTANVLLQTFHNYNTATTSNNNQKIISTQQQQQQPPRLQYIRPPGNITGLLQIFESLSTQQLPKTPKEIAQRYNIPQTSRDILCNSNTTTTIGWIPNESSYYNTSSNENAPFAHQGKIPRLIFQSWKTNQLNEKLCNLVLDWSVRNPEYDYFLFDDTSVDTFIRMEYGSEIFSSYACVKVGAAKCDVWRLFIIYMFGGVYFDADVKTFGRFADWGWGEERDQVTGRSCNIKKHPGGCAHQWGMIYAPRHPVIYSAIKETLTNLAERKANHVYYIAFWAYYNAWRNGPYNQSYMPGWGEAFGGRVLFQDRGAKDAMVDENSHWPREKKIWHDECLQ